MKIEVHFTVDMNARHGSLQAIRVSACLAILASAAYVLDRLTSCTLAYLVLLNPFSDFDNNASSFMASASCTEGRHFRHVHVIHHLMKVTSAEAGCVEFNENIVRPLTEIPDT